MKNTLLLIVLSAILSINAQLQPVLKNKRGINILPKQGEFALGCSADPFFYYFGNLFNNSSSNNPPSLFYGDNSQMIVAKYMKTDVKAYRGSFRIGVNNNTQTFEVADNSPGAPMNSFVTDEQKRKSLNIGLGAGIEKRRGNTRLQGIYGAEAILYYSTGNNMTYKYGNKLQNLPPGSSRISRRWASSDIYVGARVFGGIEYFFAPKISLGAEFGFGPSLNFRSATEQTSETYDFSNNQIVEERYSLTPKSTGIIIDTDNGDGLIRLMFYF